MRTIKMDVHIERVPAANQAGRLITVQAEKFVTLMEELQHSSKTEYRELYKGAIFNLALEIASELTLDLTAFIREKYEEQEVKA